MDLFCEALIPAGGKKFMTNTLFGNKESYLKQFKVLTIGNLANGFAIFISALASFVLWSTLHRTSLPPDWNDLIDGLSYSPYERWQNPIDALPQTITIAHDIEQLAGITRMLRTYSVLGPIGDLATQAADADIQLLAGAWTGVSPRHDEYELSVLIELALDHENITRLLVGNEVLLRKALPADTLQNHIEMVRSVTGKPVSTAEPWHVWLDHPALADAADFLAVHILPYWEGIPVDRAIPYIDRRLHELQETYPNKSIVLAEVGWPSAGKRVGGAKPSRVNQAYFVRTFLSYAKDNNIDYVLLEAYDQPWKISAEGRAGAHWGVFDAHRQTKKWGLTGSVRELPNWPYWAVFALLIGALSQAIYLHHWPDLSIVRAVLFGLCFQAWGAGLLWPYISLTNHYLSGLGLTVWLALSAIQCVLFALFASDLVELANVTWHKPRRSFKGARSLLSDKAPFISIHVPCSNEPPKIVIRTLTSLSRLDYPNYEVIVISNNCKNPMRWRPVKDACAQLGSQFHFIHRDHCPGFKAEALNLARNSADKRTQIVAVVDSDYLVDSDWLQTLMPIFENPDIAIVQAPQDHEPPGLNSFKRKCFWEYAGFFQIGMVQRNEANAIIQHGTMTLIRNAALEQVGGWGEWCITEDAELGLRLLTAGWKSAYVAKSFGRGLLPDEFNAYKSQRFRWAYGAMQILKRYGPELLGFRQCRLSLAQRYHFIAGWLPWFADAGGFLFTVGALAWTVAMTVVPDQLPPPIALFMVPVLFLFLAKQVRGYALYTMRLNCTRLDRWRAALAGLALSHTVARAILTGLITRNAPFQRTPKDISNISPREALTTATTESALLIAIMTVTIGYSLRCDLGDPSNILWLLILTTQAAPYMAALLMASSDAIERWRTPPQITSVGQVTGSVSSDKHAITTAIRSKPTKATA